MITSKLINSVTKSVYEEIEKYGAPAKCLVEFINEKGQWLAGKLGADKNIVLLGTLLMDCKLGQAYKEGRLKDHIEMSCQKAKDLLSGDEKITTNEKENILNCIQQHHGVRKFYSLEAEICCNTDCYRFISVNGFIGSIKDIGEIPLDELVKIFAGKAEEKWQALSLDICKKDLKPQCQAIKNLLSNYRG